MNTEVKIGFVVVHGIGEQQRQSPVRELALNVYRVLMRLQRERRIDNLVRFLEPDNFFQPVSFRFDHGGATWRFSFYGGYWADLDLKYNFFRRVALWSWAATLPFRFRRLHGDEPIPTGMTTPSVPPGQVAFLRIVLSLVSLAFVVTLASLRIVSFIWHRLSGKDLQWGKLLHDYLGDVKLYVGERRRSDKIETAGLKSHEAIRQRFFDAYLRANFENNEVYVLSHSLGTVVTFNALMELEHRILGLVTHPQLRQQLESTVAGNGNVDRVKLFEKLKAVITAGSPLDKFAAIWPRFVPINHSTPRESDDLIPWHNVHDVLDLVGANLNHYSDVPGFHLHDHLWVDQRWFWRAHTSYWQAGRGRLIDRIVEGILARNLVIGFPRPLARTWFYLTLNFLLAIGLAVLVVWIWYLGITMGLALFG